MKESCCNGEWDVRPGLGCTCAGEKP